MPDFQCPYCFTTGKYNERYLKDGAYVCDGFELSRDLEIGSTEKCGTFLKAYCKVCNEYYDFDRFGKLNNTYVCKKCGTIQWGVTEYQEDYEKTWFQRHFKSLKNEIICQRCTYDSKIDEDKLEDGVLICKNCQSIDQNFVACFHCKTISSLKRFGVHNNEYVCKTCGFIQWGLTEYARKK